MGVLKFLPHVREVEDFEPLKSEEESLISESREVPIKEYRDEADKSWWKYFDEYEYRLTSDESAKLEWWRWYEKGTSSAEKKLLIKLDIIIAFYAFLGYWVKYIDSANLNNAYISGMKEALDMKGNDLINTQVLFTVANIIFELPWLYYLPRCSIPYVLFACELGWALFTFVICKAQNTRDLQLLRFFVGAFEAAYFPCIHYTLASFYKPTEIGRRAGLFYMGQFLGILTSGLIQSGAVNLDGIHGYAGWRWMFMIDGSLSFVVGILALYCLPGTPAKCYSLFLTDDEIRLTRKRMKNNKSDVSDKTNNFLNKKVWIKLLKNPNFWLLFVMQMFGFNTNSASSGSFGLWLKSLNKYSTSELNKWTALPPGLGIIWIVIVCFGADITKKRFGMIFFSFIMNFIANIILAIWDVPDSAKWFGFCLCYWSWSNSSVFNPMISDFFRHDNNVRAILWMVVYISGLQSSAWISRLVFPTVDEPRYFKGFLSCAVFSILFNILLIPLYINYKRDERALARENGIYLYNSKKGEIPEEVLKRSETSSVDEQQVIEISSGKH